MFIPPPILLIIAIGVSYLVSLMFPALQWDVSRYNTLGLINIAIGSGLFLWAGTVLHSHKTTLHPRGKPTRLVSSGPYGISRNPIYLGFFLISVGTAFLFANVLAFVGPLIFFVFVRFLVIPFEEDMLQKIFGKNYISYSTRIRRWI